MKEINTTVGDLQFERYLLGELSGGERARVRRQLQSDEVLGSRLSALERSNGEILDVYPTANSYHIRPAFPEGDKRKRRKRARHER